MSKPKKDLPAGRQVKIIDIPTEILVQLLTPSEIRMLKNRWQIVKLLNEGLSIRQIAEQVGVGTDTVVRVTRLIEKNNFRKLAKSQITQTSPTSWVFGKSDE